MTPASARGAQASALKSIGGHLKTLIAGALAALAVTAAGEAAAATITRTFTFSAPMDWGPIDTFVGSATITFDPTVTTMTTTTGARLHYASAATDSPFSYAYWDWQDTLFFGGSNGGAEGLYMGTNDFFVHIKNPAGDQPVLTWLSYSTAAGPYGNTYTGSVSFKDVSAVPEPGAWALMLIGFFGLGSALRRARPVLA